MSTPQTPDDRNSAGNSANEGMRMPPPIAGMPPVSSHGETDESQGGVDLPPPSSFVKQMAQLVIVPAAIVLVAVGVAVLFGKLAGSSETLDNQLLRLEQSSGAGRIVGNVQDPRYKDRGLAAYNVALMIPTLTDAQGHDGVSERRSVSDRLIKILRNNVDPKEENLQIYLLSAIGQLGQPGGLELIIEMLSGTPASMRQGAVRGLLSWRDHEEARAALPQVAALLADNDPTVRRDAAAAAGALGSEEDRELIAALHGALTDNGAGFREAQWNAAVALAKLGVEEGSQFVAGVLLNRAALAAMPAAESGPMTRAMMSPASQDRVILSTLGSAPGMNSKAIWDRIEGLASSDPNRKIQGAARSILGKRPIESK